MKAELVFNLDEVGMSEWEDRKEKKVIVPTFMDDRTIGRYIIQHQRESGTYQLSHASPPQESP
jgi:hypothetical protein